jgi:hypothetical protein
MMGRPDDVRGTLSRVGPHFASRPVADEKRLPWVVMRDSGGVGLVPVERHNHLGMAVRAAQYYVRRGRPAVIVRVVA